MWVCETTTITTTSPAMATKEPREKKWCDKKKHNEMEQPNNCESIINSTKYTHTHIFLFDARISQFYFFLSSDYYLLFTQSVFLRCCSLTAFYGFVVVVVIIIAKFRFVFSFTLPSMCPFLFGCSFLFHCFGVFFWNFLFDMMINRDLRAKLKSTAVQLYHASKLSYGCC